MIIRNYVFAILCTLILISGSISAQVTQSPEPANSAKPATSNKSAIDLEVDRNLYNQTTQAAVKYLLEKGQSEDGSYSKELSPAVTAMCTRALLDHGIPLNHPQIQKSLTYLETLVQPNGGVYPRGSNLRNYETCVSLMCFHRANADGKYDKTIADAVSFLKGLQWDEGEGHNFESSFYGGVGYGDHKRPDASNASYFLDALEAVGEDGDSAAVQKALVFMSRTQNLPSKHNTSQWAAKVTPEDRGGSIYTAAGAGESKPGETPEGGLRSYASMTYVGLKSFLYAGVSKDDIRVQASLDWIRRNYDLKSNPGMGQQGLFYYYHVFAKTLDAVGEPIFNDAHGQPHNWRNELIQELADSQTEDGSWINEADRWYEGDPNLVTSYVLMALTYCDPDRELGEE